MAGDNQFVFTTDDGGPLVFFIRPSETKARLRPLIEKGGGTVTSKSTGEEEHVIRIASNSDIISGGSYIKAQYVEDCLAEGRLLDTEKYQCQSQSSKPIAEPGTSHIMESVNTAGRMRYTEDEDRAILEYVAKHPKNYGGNAMWKKMECMKITGHSWQSMRDHFLKHLEGRLQEYIELERDYQRDVEMTREHSDEDAIDLSEEPAPADKDNFVFDYLKGMEDPGPDIEDPDEPDGIEQQVIVEINHFCQKFSISRKAVAMAIDLNNGDMAKTEEFLRSKSLPSDARVWSHRDDSTLLQGGKYSELCDKYGKQSVRERQVYLRGDGGA